MKKKTKQKKQDLLLMVTLSMSILATGCGGSQNAPASVTTPSGGSNLTLGSSATTTPAAADSSSTTTGTPPIGYSFKLQGKANTFNGSCANSTPAGVSVGSFTTPAAILTDKTLKVTIKSASPSQLPCAGYTPYYTCEQFNVTLVDTSVVDASGRFIPGPSQTVTVSYGNPLSGVCAKVPNSVDVDFSGQFDAGHGPLKVVVSQPQSDNCRLMGGWGIYYGGCTMTDLYDNYINAGTIQIHTDTTQ